jgi:putative ABC transport system permease protein
MTRHILRLMWHRKRHNALIALEVFISFLVLLGVIVLAVYYVDNYRYPLGFDIDRVWRVSLRIDPGKQGDDPVAARARARAATEQVLIAVRQLPEVEAAAMAFTAPYDNASWGSGYSFKGRLILYGMNEVSDDFRGVIDLPLIAGRWFSREDNGVRWRPVVLNAKLATEVFGSPEAAVGRPIERDPEPHMDRMTPEERADIMREMRVIGVVQDFRQHGELSAPESYLFRRLSLDDPQQGAPRILLLKLRQGTTAEFEERLVKAMQGAAPDWSFEVTPLENLRATMLRQYLLPLVALGIVSGFLMIMVALGLTGVVWQNVTQRTREIGLRRAKGATRASIQRQLMGELGLITTVAIALGIVLVAQAPLLPLPGGFQLPKGVLLVSLVLASGLIYALVIGCAWYPGHMATRIEPAEALRYE